MESRLRRRARRSAHRCRRRTSMSPATWGTAHRHRCRCRHEPSAQGGCGAEIGTRSVCACLDAQVVLAGIARQFAGGVAGTSHDQRQRSRPTSAHPTVISYLHLGDKSEREVSWPSGEAACRSRAVCQLVPPDRATLRSSLQLRDAHRCILQEKRGQVVQRPLHGSVERQVQLQSCIGRLAG